MDESSFDNLARMVAWLRTGTPSRRGVVRPLAAGAVAVLLAHAGGAETVAGCKARGKTCDRNGDCCSQRCSRGDECRCGRLEATCKSAADCCGDLACSSSPPKEPLGECCVPHGGSCEAASDCCPAFQDCCGGVCKGAVGSTCESDDDCCPEAPVCCVGTCAVICV